MKAIYKKIKNNHNIELNIKIHENDSPIWIVHVHGLGEHIERHDFLYEEFARDYNIVSFDLTGHGKSSGERASIDSFDLFNDDIEVVLNYISKEYNMNRYILMGHSMGGLIVTNFLYKRAGFIKKPEALFLSSPALGQSGVAGKVADLIPLSFIDKLAGLKKGIYLKGVLDMNKLSHDEDIYKDYVSDPLNSVACSTTLLLKIISTSREISPKFMSFDFPIYGSVGSADALVSCESVAKFFKRNNSSENLKIIQDGYHELHNEVPKYRLPYLEFLKKILLNIRYPDNAGS